MPGFSFSFVFSDMLLCNVPVAPQKDARQVGACTVYHISCVFVNTLPQDIVNILCKDFKFVRVDLYNICGEIYFGELTFYPASGYGKFTEEKWDIELGNLIDLSKVKMNEK